MKVDERFRSERGAEGPSGGSRPPKQRDRSKPGSAGDGLDYFRGMRSALPVSVALWLVIIVIVAGILLLWRP
jgi:hypothetical protein